VASVVHPPTSCPRPPGEDREGLSVMAGAEPPGALLPIPVGLDQTVRYVNDATGKDRLLRLFVYVGRLAIWAFQRRGWSGAVERLKSLDASFNLTRRVLRLGKLAGAPRQCNDCYAKFWCQWTFFAVEAVKVASGNAYLVCDHMRWLGETGVLRSIDWKRWGDWSTWCWFINLLGSLVMACLQVRVNRAREQALLHDLNESRSHPQLQLDQQLTDDEDDAIVERQRMAKEKQEQVKQFEVSLFQLRQARSLLYWDIAKNVWDAPLAMVGSFKITSVPGGVLEVFGSISSLISCYLLWRTMFPTPFPTK